VYYNLCTFEKTKYNKYRVYCAPDVFNKTITIHVKLVNGQADDKYFCDVIKSGLNYVCKYYYTKTNEMSTDYINGIYQKAVSNIDNDNWKIKIFARALYVSFDFIQDGFICNIAGQMDQCEMYKNRWDWDVTEYAYRFSECDYYRDMVYALNLMADYDESLFGLSKNDYKNRILKQSIKYVDKITVLCKENDSKRILIWGTPSFVLYNRHYANEMKNLVLHAMLYLGNKSDDKKISKEKACFLIWLADRLMMRKYGKRLAELTYIVREDSCVPIYMYIETMIFNDEPVLIDCYQKEKEYISDTDEPFNNSVKFLMVNYGDELEAISDYDDTVLTDDIKESLDKVYEYFNDFTIDELSAYIQTMPEWKDGRYLDVNSFFLGNDEFFDECEDALMSMYEKYSNDTDDVDY